MTEKTANQSPEKYKRLCGWMTAGYNTVGAGLFIYYLVRRNWYLAVQSLGTIVLLWTVFLLLRLLHIKPVYSYQAVIIGFMFAAYTMGVACALYQRTPYYDKLLHMLSGTFTMMLALPLFYVLKAGHRLEKSDCALAVCFCLATTLAVAGIWEIAEYIFSLVTPMDPQCVLATGVADTMQDTIVCLLGGLIGVPSMVRLYRSGKGGILYSQVSTFIELNMPESA